jgi:hypothetical protein
MTRVIKLGLIPDAAFSNSNEEIRNPVASPFKKADEVGLDDEPIFNLITKKSK